MKSPTTDAPGAPARACLVAILLLSAHACGGSAPTPRRSTTAGPEAAGQPPTAATPSDPSVSYGRSDVSAPADPAGPSDRSHDDIEPGPAAAPNAEAQPRSEPAAANEAQRIVDAHNRHRAKHCAPPLTWSDEIAAVAEAWATRLRDAGCAFQHSQSRTYGENLFFMGPAGVATGVGAVDDWYSEVASYDFSKPGFGMSTGHFTQVVWRGTTQVGCGTARCPGGDIWVCNYYPPGNVLGQFPQHVLPATCK